MRLARIYASPVVGFPERAGPWPAIRRELERQNRRPVVAVVAYIGKGAPDIMPLRAGDTLVCDASETAVRSRMTSAAALATYRRRGVELFSVEGLHAKVIAAPTSAWIGSANASDHSQDHLIEASIRVVGEQARRLHRWATAQAIEDRALSAGDLAALKKLKLAPYRPGPRRTRVPAELPTALTRIQFIETDSGISKRQAAAIELDRSAARTAARSIGLPSPLSPIYLWADLTLSKGDWVVDIRHGRVRPPAQVIRVGVQGRARIAWLCPVKTKARPNVNDLRAVVPALASGFNRHVISGRSRVQQVLDLYI